MVCRVNSAPVIGIIPARLGSTRFPRKILASETGWPLIRHVYENAQRAKVLSRVVIACDDEEVRRIASSFGAEAILTDPSHPNGSSRIHEAAAKLGLSQETIIVNVQGDEPLLEPEAIEAAVAALSHGPASMSTVASPFLPGEDPSNPNIVKVVIDQAGCAMYFSRSLIPFARAKAAPPLRHTGLYAYRLSMLGRYVTWKPTPLEEAESLEQLRVLEHGEKIAVAIHASRSIGIDTPEQYAAFVASSPKR
jgi:3-deoxy-manno-octulosonate cytidylyltransferase (CMP-KDO synthetase)